MRAQTKHVALWAVWILVLPALALNWWEWQLALERLTSLDWDNRALVGLGFAAFNVGAVTAIGVDRGWFKKSEPGK